MIELQTSYSDVRRMFDGEAVPYGGGLTGRQFELPGELAEVCLLGRLRACFAELDFDLSVGGDGDVVVHGDAGLAGSVILDGGLVGDVDRAGAADDGLACRATAQLALDPDLVVDAKL